MLLKRVYDDNGNIACVKVLKATKRQKFTQRMLDMGFTEGFMAIADKRITLKTTEGDMVFDILNGPGIYCCHDEKKLPSEQEARAYVAANFNGIPSPDTQNPSGYRRDNFYLCEQVN
jgi:hypothetical protein